MAEKDTTRTGNKASAEVQLGQVIERAAANSPDLETLTQPLLEAMASLANLESTFLTVFDWNERTQQVRFVHNMAEPLIQKGMEVPLPEGAMPESLPGVTRSPKEVSTVHPDSVVAQRIGLKTYVSVPVSLAKHQLFGMLCGASRAAAQVSEGIVSVMEFFAQIIADHIDRSRVAATERRAHTAEEQLQSRARFLAEAEHMLKAPLTVLEGMSVSLLERWSEYPESSRTKMLEALVRNAQELEMMVDELLTEARADVQARELTMLRIDLSPLVESAAKAFDSVSESHKVITEVPEGIAVWADPAPLHQILAHLLDNAIKYSPSPGTIKIRATSAPPDVIIEVIDEGVGVPEEANIFEPFVRGEESVVTEGTRGIGLGLHIVRSLAEAMGGSVSASRNPERGSTLTVQIPSAP